MKTITALLVVLLALALVLPAEAQYKDQGGLGGGVGFGGVYGRTDLKSDGEFLARAYLRMSFVRGLQGELGAALGKIAGDEYETQIFPIDFRLLLHPLSVTTWNPYLYAGIGVMQYKIKSLPPEPTPGVKTSSWTGVVPVGLGLQFPMSDQVSFEVSGGYNMTFSKALEAVTKDKNDAFANFLVGMSVSGESGSADPDGDGLTNKEEKELKTDPHKADSDGDGLTDGEEIKTYKTDALKGDSDGDMLADGEEVKTNRTDPNKADTDGDALSDGEEIQTRRTDALKADTDGDALADGDEVNMHKTDPLKADTDGDELTDGLEINKHKSNPLMPDSDGGTLADGLEVARGLNPMDPSDDIPTAVKVAVGEAIVLEGVEFKTGSAEITPASDETLTKVYNAMSQNPGIEVEIQGYTDNTGKKATNQKLSLARAEAVKKYMVDKGISASRMTTKGFGPDKPIADNKTKEGRQKNRRIEFLRLK
ncbi:MAG: Peptidoglycan-associated outer membrane protein [Bacteroidetes bacterium]|nr:Peptidoglycan-associated outer membrane protein [Bacteroidota bacterium]